MTKPGTICWLRPEAGGLVGRDHQDLPDLQGDRDPAAEQDAQAAVKPKLRDDRQEASGPNEVWAMDFVHDQLAMGKILRILTIVDTFSRYVPALESLDPLAMEKLEGIHEAGSS